MGWSHRLVLTGIGSGYLASLFGSWRAFAGAAKRPWKTQADLLDGWIARHRDTAYGKMHGVDRIDTIEAFQSRLPIIDYEALRPFIDRIAKGEANVLSPLPVRALEPSSGTTGGNKLIPYDDLFLDEFSRATAPWLFTTYASRPRLFGTSSYWSVSPAAREKKKSEGGIPIGFSDDTEYFGPMERWALRRMMAVPGTVAGIEEIEEWRFVTAQHLLSDRDLGFISVWNPSFLTLLMEAIEERFGELVDTLPEKGRARELRRVSSLDGRALWPRLRLISCW